MRSPGLLEPNHRILVIDDNQAIHEDLRKVLLSEVETQERLQDDEALLFGMETLPITRFEIDSAYQGQDGLAKLEQSLAEGRPYALAFVDVRMPLGWDGVETIAHLWRVYPHLQVVMCTAYSDYSWKDIQRQLGYSDNLLVLKKPFDDIEVIQLAHTLSRKWLLSRQAEARLADLDLMVAKRTAELKFANEQYRLIAETASDGIVTMDIEGNIRFANTAAGSIFGYPGGDLAGQNFFSLVPEFKRHLAVMHPRSGPVVEVIGNRRNGRAMTLEASFAWSPGGGATILTAVLRDVTERRNLERHRALTQKLESIGRLAAGVAHEINTPIQYTADNLEFIRRSWDSLERMLGVYGRLTEACEAKEPTDGLVLELRRIAQKTKADYLWWQTPNAIREASEGVRRVAEIVRAMHDFAHPGAGEMTPTDLNRLIETTVVVSRNKWKDAAELRIALDPALPPVACVAGQISQVFLNLIVNAADAVIDAVNGNRRKKGTIQITSRREGEFAEVRVSDSGIGIPEAVQPKIFDLFFTTKEVGRGSGQGLAIAHAIVVQKHHGHIGFETAAGAGTTFIVRLPIQPANGNRIDSAHGRELAAQSILAEGR
jgi:PAS domain S-box-containing protein